VVVGGPSLRIAFVRATHRSLGLRWSNASTEGLCGQPRAEGLHAPGDAEDWRGRVADGGAGEWECEVVEGRPAEAVLVAQRGWEDVWGREPVGGRE